MNKRQMTYAQEKISKMNMMMMKKSELNKMHKDTKGGKDKIEKHIAFFDNLWIIITLLKIRVCL